MFTILGLIHEENRAEKTLSPVLPSISCLRYTYTCFITLCDYPHPKSKNGVFINRMFKSIWIQVVYQNDILDGVVFGHGIPWGNLFVCSNPLGSSSPSEEAQRFHLPLHISHFLCLFVFVWCFSSQTSIKIYLQQHGANS